MAHVTRDDGCLSSMFKKLQFGFCWGFVVVVPIFELTGCYLGPIGMIVVILWFTC